MNDINRMPSVGDVIQATEKAGDWCGCLLIVDEVKTWGVQAGMKIPFKGTAYMRLKDDQYEVIGKAVMVEVRESTE